jgi:thioredoxin-related protein
VPFSLYRIGAALLLAVSFGNGFAQALDSTDDWSRVGAIARSSGFPVVVVVTGEGCGHCARMRRDLFSDPNACILLENQAVTRELHRDTGGKVTDFDGERVRSRIFLSRYDVFATPTVLFLDPDGEPLAAPLVGYNDPEGYRQLLSERLDQSRLALARREKRAVPALADVPGPSAR